MALTQISTNGVKNNTLTSDDIASSAITVSELAVDAVEDDRIKTSNSPSAGKFLQYKDASDKLTWATVTVPDADKVIEGNTSVEAVDTGSDGHVKITTEGNERYRVDKDGSILVNTTTRSTSGASNNALFTVAGNRASATGEGQLNLWKKAVPAVNDTLGQINFIGDEGAPGAVIKAEADLAWDQGGDTTDHPGRLVFSTTADNDSNVTERFRVGSAGQLGVAGANYGTSGQVLTSGGSGAAPSWTTISAAPEVTMTADGAIAANTAVIVKPDGDVKSITGIVESISSETTGPAMTIRNSYADNAHYLSTAFDSANNKILAVWEEDRSDNQIYASVGTINQTNNTISWASKVLLWSWDGVHRDWLKICCVNSNRYVLVYRRAGNRGYAAALNVSGNSVSVVSEQQMHPFSYATQMHDICKIATNKWAAVYNPSQYASQRIFTGTHNGSSNMTMDGETEVYPNTTGSTTNYGNDPRLCYISSLDKVVVTWHLTAGTGKIQARCFKDGSDGNFENADRGDILDVEPSTASYYPALQDPFPLWDEKNQKLLIIYAGGDGKPVVRICSISGNNITMESSSMINITGNTTASTSTQMYGAIDSTSGQVVVVMRDENNNNKPTYMGFKLNAAKDGIVQNTNSTYYGASGTQISALDNRPEQDIELIGDSKFIFTYVPDTTGGNANTNRYLKSRFKIYPSTDLTTENFIGFSGDAISDNASGTIKVTGNTTTQSGLTPGQRYYLTNAGGLSTTAGEPSVEAGIALTSTKLLIKG